jgi:hypothetical protein
MTCNNQSIVCMVLIFSYYIDKISFIKLVEFGFRTSQSYVSLMILILGNYGTKCILDVDFGSYKKQAM